MDLVFASFFTSLCIALMAIPSIIRIAEVKHLFDEPGERKSHLARVPTLGGAAIFAGLFFSLTFWSTQKEIVELQYILCSLVLLFFMGIKDDLFNLVVHKKLIGQLLASFILVHWAGIRVTSFFGLFGINDLGVTESYFFSIFTMVVVTNSFNLIDGIDGLAGSIGVIAAGTFGIWFHSAEQTQYAILSASLVGALFGFLYYNRTPARIFMGDTGSLIIGVVISILAIKFIEMNRILPLDVPNKIRGVPVFAMSVLIIPLFDTLRVFAIRSLQGRSPFAPDRNHIHHLLVDLGFTHMMATLCLVVFNLCTIVAVYYTQNIRSELVLTVLLFASLAVTSVLANFRQRRVRQGSFWKGRKLFKAKEKSH